MNRNGSVGIGPSVSRSQALLSAVFVAFASLGTHSALARTGRAQNPAKPLSLSQYEAELDDCAAALGQLQEHREAALKLRQDLPASWRVITNGQEIDVSTAWLSDSLKLVSKDPKQRGNQIRGMKSRLISMRREAAELERAMASAEITSSQARNALTAILARREFGAVRGPTWLDIWRERIYQWLDGLLERFERRLGNHPSFGVILFWATIAFVACTLVIWMVRRLLRPGEVVRLGLAESPSASSSWRSILDVARQAAAHGDYREAIRLAYRACIDRLEELGIWKVDQTRTHREYLRLLSPAQPQWEPLSVVTRQFEFAWYAGRPSSEKDFEATLTQLEALGCAAGSTPPIARLSS